MTSNLKCPDSEQLIDFSQGRLSDKHLAQIANHLGTCRECEEALLRMDELCDPFLSTIRNAAISPALCRADLGVCIENTFKVIQRHFHSENEAA